MRFCHTSRFAWPLILLLLTGTSALLFAACSSSTSEEAISVTVALLGTGSGTVTSSHPHADINCTITLGTTSGSCFDDFNDLEGTPSLMLTATAQPGSMFVNWGGCPSVQGNVCTIDVTQSGDWVITAGFNLQ